MSKKPERFPRTTENIFYSIYRISQHSIHTQILLAMKNYFDLTGQVVVVTGASTGLGLQMAKAFANQGANLVLLARRMNLLEENARSIKEEFGVDVLPFACDITDTDWVKDAVKATLEKF